MTYSTLLAWWPGGRAKSGHQAYRRARLQLERGGADTVGARGEESERAPPTNHWYATHLPSLPPDRRERQGKRIEMTGTDKTIRSELFARRETHQVLFS